MMCFHFHLINFHFIHRVRAISSTSLKVSPNSEKHVSYFITFFMLKRNLFALMPHFG